MPVRIWAAAAALLAPAAEGLAAQAFLGAAVVEPDATPEDGMRSWLERAEKANEGLDEELRKVMSELASTARQEKDPRTKKEQQLQMLEDLLKQYDTENETSIDETSKRMAAIAFRKAIRNHIRKPHRKSGKADTKPGDAVDRKMADEFSEWVQEANRATHDLEKQLSADESDLGLPKPKSAEEKSLDRVADLIDEVDPKNASEMADLADELHQKARTLGGELKPRAEPAGEAAQERRSARPVLPTFAPYGSEEEAARVWRERLNGSAEAADAMKSWMAEADQATSDIDREIDEAIDELKDEAPKSDEEKDLERMQNLIDATDPDNASEVADLAASLARSGSFTRRVGKFAAPPASGWSQKVAKEFWSWLKSAETESRSLDRDLDASTKELSEYLKGMTSKQEFAVHKELEMLEEIWAKYGLENESATAEDVMERVQLHRVRRTQ
mmetsp:Transcript_28534/g.76162  ORF Transcript_28534/g.76162 Transcript_28534/m.76162 type:complete len:445 (+) Transcript_28534:62-1396(+)